MAPRPKTYGTRRSYAKATGELVNGTTADQSEPNVRRVDVMSERMTNGKEKDLGIARKEEKQEIPSQEPGEDESASGTPVGQRAAPSRTPDVEDKPKPVSPAPGSLKRRRMSAQDMLPPDTSIKERDSRRKSTRRSVNRSATSEKQSPMSITSFESIPTDRISSLHAKADLRPNGFTEDHGQSPVVCDVDLKDTPSDLHDLAIWVARSISKYSDKSPISAVSEPRRKDHGPQHGQDIEMSDALDNVEGVRMTRGKEKKRLQQLKGKEPANELSGKAVSGLGKSLRPRDVAPTERQLRDDLNDELKRKLFGPSATINVSTNGIEWIACGKLLFNTLVEMKDTANRNSAAVLKSALKERKDDAPFLSALKILASSSEIMAFINFLFSKDDAPQWEASNADESRPSTSLDTSGATTITETSDLTSRAGTSISDAEGLSKATSRNKAIDDKNPEKRKRSQEVIQALEAATTVLIQLQQGEAGTGYMAPYTSGNMIPSPTGHGHMITYGTTYGPPYPDHPTYGMAYGPPVGANPNNYASPYGNPVAPHPGSYASPYSNPVNQPPANYASPYANPVVPNQASGSGLVSSGDNQINNHDGHDDREAYASHKDIIGALTEANKGNDEAAGQDISNEEGYASKASRETDDQGVNNKKEETVDASGRTVSNEKGEVSNVVDLDETDVDDANKQNSNSVEDETSIDDDLTGNDMTTAKIDSQNIAPPAENHRLFTGERLGDFTSRENIDWLLTVGNGGKIPKRSKNARMVSPASSSSSQTDAKIQMEVDSIINEIMLCKDWRDYPGGTMKLQFYASAEGQRLAAELKRLMANTKPVVNTIIPQAESQARLRFYQQLESRAIREKRDREIAKGINRYYGAPVQMHQWGPPPVGFPVAGLPIPPPLPSSGPIEEPFVRRGNVIVAPPGGRNIEEERKAETFGYPPMPGSRPGGSRRSQKMKRAARH